LKIVIQSFDQESLKELLKNVRDEILIEIIKPFINKNEDFVDPVQDALDKITH